MLGRFFTAQHFPASPHHHRPELPVGGLHINGQGVPRSSCRYNTGFSENCHQIPLSPVEVQPADELPRRILPVAAGKWRYRPPAAARVGCAGEVP